MPNQNLANELRAFLDPDTGLIKAEDAHDWAMENPSSELFKHLNDGGWWDDAKAGRQWRIHIIRKLIVIHVVDDQGDRETVSLRIDRVKEGGGYRMITDVKQEPDLVQQAIKDAVADAMHFVRKYAWLRTTLGVRGVDALFTALDAFIEQNRPQPRPPTRRPERPEDRPRT